MTVSGAEAASVSTTQPRMPACWAAACAQGLTGQRLKLRGIFNPHISHRKGTTSAHFTDRETETWRLRTVLQVTERMSGRSRNREFGGWCSHPIPPRAGVSWDVGGDRAILTWWGPRLLVSEQRQEHLSRTEPPPCSAGRGALTGTHCLSGPSWRVGNSPSTPGRSFCLSGRAGPEQQQTALPGRDV